MRCRVTNKVMHKNERAAACARQVVKLPMLSVYRCQHCQSWHLGTPRKPGQAQSIHPGRSIGLE